MAGTPITRDFPHLDFKRCWRLTEPLALNLGRCDGFAACLEDLPLDPAVQQELKAVSFERGAQASTAIEGNTLSDAELRQLLAGRPLPPSRQYQAREVHNVLGLMNELWSRVVVEGRIAPVTVDLLCEFNRAIGRELGPLYDGSPGRLRRDRRTVGRYLTPPPEAVPQLLKDFCAWLPAQFGPLTPNRPLSTAVVESIVAHVFFEWIHPFADGNGRTGRMLEFYILLCAGMPGIAAHVLANHYNLTRTEYTAHFDKARQKRDLTEFLDYAVQGFIDGLRATWARVQRETFRVAWEAFVYRTFEGYTDYQKRSIFKRRRQLALSMPLDRPFTLMELARSSDELAAAYLGKDQRALKADLEKVLELGLAERGDGETFRAATDRLRHQHAEHWRSQSEPLT